MLSVVFESEIMVKNNIDLSTILKLRFGNNNVNYFFVINSCKENYFN